MRTYLTHFGYAAASDTPLVTERFTEIMINSSDAL